MSAPQHSSEYSRDPYAYLQSYLSVQPSPFSYCNLRALATLDSPEAPPPQLRCPAGSSSLHCSLETLKAARWGICKAYLLFSFYHLSGITVLHCLNVQHLEIHRSYIFSNFLVVPGRRGNLVPIIPFWLQGELHSANTLLITSFQLKYDRGTIYCSQIRIQTHTHVPLAYLIYSIYFLVLSVLSLKHLFNSNSVSLDR